MTEASQVKLTNRQIWKTLGTHYESISNVHLRSSSPNLRARPSPGSPMIVQLTT